MICETCRQIRSRCSCVSLRLAPIAETPRRRWPDIVKRIASTDLPVFRPRCDHDSIKADGRRLEVETTFAGIQADGYGGELELRNCKACRSTIGIWRGGRS